MLDRLLNYLTLISWIVFAVYVILYLLRNWQLYGLREALRKLIDYRLLIAVVVLVSITLLSISLVFIEPQEVGVVVSLTEPDGYRDQPLRSGLHWIVPMMERVEHYPIYWQTYTMSAEPLEGAKSGNDTISARTSDGQEVFLDTSVIFRIDPNDVIRVHIDWQGRYINDFIRPLMRGIVRTEVSQFTADEVNSSKRKVLESNLDELLREEVSAKGFILDRFLLRKIAFSPQYASAVEAKQVAEQARVMKEYEAEQIRTIAEAIRDKTRIEAEGRATAVVLEGQANADVILLTARNEKEALQLIADALQKDPNLIVYRYIDKLGPGIQVMLLPSDNPLLLPVPQFGTPVPSAQLQEEIANLLGTTTPTPSPTPTPTPTATP